jgi:serine/threonine protein kinase
LPGIPLNADGLISLAGLHSAKDAQASQPATPRTVRTTPASTTASSGRKIGNYEIKKLIGKGGMGSVFLAEHPHLGRRVAIKTLAPHLATYEEQVARFAAEAKAIAQIEHSNVVEIFDFGQSEDNELYFVMELLDGPNLADIIADKAPMSQATVLEYARQLCAALKAAHDCGVVHRDFKPENVVVVSQEPLFLKVVDFGLAKFYEEPQQGNSRTATGMVMGTPLTIAPEQAAGHPQLIAPATDIYSLAVVLFWMLTGEPPFDDEVAAVLLAKHIRERAPRLTEKRGDVSKALSDLVADCMHKDPRQRPQRTEAVLEGLISAIGEQSEDSRETTPTSQRSKTPRSSTTTLRRATGETQRIERESNGRGRFYTALFTIAAAIIGAALIIANREPRVPKPPTALSQPIKQLPPPYKPPPAVKKVELMVMLSDTRARCRYRIANGELRSQKPPCVIKAKAGQRLELEVARKGMRSFKKQLVLEANQTLRLRRKGRRYLLKETHAGKR